jgi:HTH-type transcriptional regulator / antitoxin HigA
MPDAPPPQIKTEQEYRDAVKEMERLFEEDPEPDTPEGEELERLSKEVARYEDEHYPMRE